ncbi:MAG: NYN domain-containing protein [Synechococcales cyanobacterium M58_A2018_015]|nr:NYN domain-containing protein [Synechococcales cyanobacterium M58_A2018_015]
MVDRSQSTRLAVLIDAENLSPMLIKPTLTRLQSQQMLLLKRAYGDWSRLKGWDTTLSEFGILPVHVPKGKNAADMQLAVDAMDLLRCQQIHWFCIVSNDSDFTPLVHRLAEAGAKVVGVGTEQASRAFVQACHRFIRLTVSEPTVAAPTVTEPIVTEPTGVAPAGLHLVLSPPPVADAAKAKSTAERPTLSKKQLPQALQQIFRTLSPQNNWVDLSRIHSQLQKQYAHFSCKQLGYSSLVQLVEATQLFELQQKPVDAKPDKKTVEIRLKRAA